MALQEVVCVPHLLITSYLAMSASLMIHSQQIQITTKWKNTIHKQLKEEGGQIDNIFKQVLSEGVFCIQFNIQAWIPANFYSWKTQKAHHWNILEKYICKALMWEFNKTGNSYH